MSIVPRKFISLSPLSLFCLLSCATPVLFAQVPNFNIGDAVKNANTPTVPPKQEVPPAPVIIQQEERPLTMEEGKKILVRDFRVEGADFIDPQEISAVFDSYRNRELTIGEINEAASRLTVLCRSKGYLVARAYVPKQNIQNDVLTIKVIAGKYGTFQIRNQSLVKDATLQAPFDKAKKDSAIVSRDGLERPMLLVSDMPGAALPKISIAPGAEPGTSDFTVEVPSVNRYTGYAVVDNYGSRFTGKNRLSAGLDINSPFGIADRLSLTALTTKDAGLQNGRAAYSIPLSDNGLRGEVAFTRTTYKLGEEYAQLDANGVADILEGTLSYPIKRTQNDSVYLSFNVANKHLRDDIDLLESSIGKQDKTATLSLQRETFGNLFGFRSYTNLTGSFTTGHLSFDDAQQKAFNKAGANTEGSFSKLNLNFNGNLGFTEKWSMTASLQAQKSLGKNLDGVEQLSLSGPSGIKSYPDGVTGDDGYLVGLELKYALPTIANVEQSVGLFTNYGEVSPHDDSFTTSGTIAIGDVGLGYYLSHKIFFGSVQVAHTTGVQSATSSYNHDLKVLAQLGMRF